MKFSSNSNSPCTINCQSLRRIDGYKNKVLAAVVLISSSILPSYANVAANDIHINDLISRAIETHPLVQSARAERQATTEGINAAKLNLLPEPSFSTGYNQNNDAIISEVGVRQSLWTGGRLTANVNQAIFDDKAAAENIFVQQNQVAKTTIEAWQTYINAVAQQRVYLETLEQLHTFEEMMKRRVSQGISARIELELVTNRISQESSALEAAQEQQKIAEARLAQLTGHALPVGSEHGVPPLGLLTEQAKIASANFETLAFNNISFYNPVVVKDFFAIEAARQEVKAQDANKYPTVYAEYKHTYDHDSKEDDGKFYVGLNYQPGAGFSNAALTRASAARVNSLIQNREASQRSVMEDIQVEYQRFASAKSREVSLLAAVAGAQIVLNSYERQFKVGRKSWLEVLNAVREQSDYKIQLVQTRANMLASFYKLQVDFGQMPWQRRFADNRQTVVLFNATDPIRDWMSKQTNHYNHNTPLTHDNSADDANTYQKGLQLGYAQSNSSQQHGYMQNNGFENVSVEDGYVNVNTNVNVTTNTSQPASVESVLIEDTALTGDTDMVIRDDTDDDDLGYDDTDNSGTEQ